MNGPEQRKDRFVAFPGFDGKSALSGSGQELVRRKKGGDTAFQAQAYEAGCGQDDGIVFPFIETGKARIDVAPEVGDHKVRPQVQQLGFTAQTGRTDDGAFGKVSKTLVADGDEGVFFVSPLRDSTQNQAAGEF